MFRIQDIFGMMSMICAGWMGLIIYTEFKEGSVDWGVVIAVFMCFVAFVCLSIMFMCLPDEEKKSK